MSELLRLDKFLADSGKGTRSEVKNFIRKGRIQINGAIVKDPATKVNPGSDNITLDGSSVSFVSNYYYMLYKPAGCVSATKDRISGTVLDILKNEPKTENLFPIGRLDKDTEGLLIISDDGILAHNLLSPKKHVDKTYLAVVDKAITKDHMSLMENGIDIGDDKPCLPAKIEPGQYDGAIPHEAAYLLTIHEGRYHQVKRMFEACGSTVVYLKRISMGKVVLDENLNPGEYRPLTETELDALINN